ncbi:MAG: hypothetical protein KN64_14870 [Sulfurovum sp. AS07-7]|nr:MAG: hypothetical protein KN64_14870 [Sulfurovum sp. AS07-7]
MGEFDYLIQYENTQPQNTKKKAGEFDYLIQYENTQPQQSAPQKNENQHQNIPLDKAEQYGRLHSFLSGGLQGYASVASSINKLIGDEDGRKYWNDIKNSQANHTQEHSNYALGGEILLDPLNLAPAGIITKGSKLAKVAKSIAGGAVVGSGTTAIHNYGETGKSQADKNSQIAMGAGIAGAVNGVISALTRGKVDNGGEVINNIIGKSTPITTKNTVNNAPVASLANPASKMIDIAPENITPASGKSLVEPIDPQVVQDDIKNKTHNVARDLFQRSYDTINANTGNLLKPMVLDKLMQNPTIIEDLAKQYGYNDIKYFTTKPELIDTIAPDGKKIEGAKSNKFLKENGYKNGTIYIYNPFEEEGAFNDQLYTKAWRTIHELAHAISEKTMQSRYGDSKRMGAMDFGGLTLENAQRAIEWEDVAFRTQVKLLNDIGVPVNEQQAIADFNLAAHDTIARAITGEFSNPEKFGVLPKQGEQRVPIDGALQLLENQSKANNKFLGKDFVEGTHLPDFRPISQSELDRLVKFRGLDKKRL